MKLNKRIIFKTGLLIAPISLVTVATACSSEKPIITIKNSSDTAQIEKNAANAELAKVTLNFANKENVIASSVQITSTFISDGFDKSKYDLQVTNVVVQNDKKSINVTFHLNFKESKVDPKTVSDDRSLVIAGFKEQQAIKPIDPSTSGQQKHDSSTPLSANDPKILDVTSRLKSFVSESLKNLTPLDIIGSKDFSNDFFNSLIAELNKPDSKISFDTKKLQLEIGDKSLKFTTKIFDHIKNGLAYLFKTNGGDIQQLADVLMSKKNSIEQLLSTQPIEKFVNFLQSFAKFDKDWKETLINSLNSQTGFDIMFNFDNLEILAKTPKNDYKKLITFDKTFFEAIKRTLSTELITIFNKFEKNDSTPTLLNSFIPALVELISNKIFEGSWVINRNSKTGKVEIKRPTLLKTTMNNA